MLGLILKSINLRIEKLLLALEVFKNNYITISKYDISASKNVDCCNMYHHDMVVVLIYLQMKVKKMHCILYMKFSTYGVFIKLRLPGGAIDEIVYTEFAVLVPGAVDKNMDG